MAVRLLPKDLPELLDRLKEKLPDSMTVYTSIKLIIRGLSGYEVCADNFPDFRAVLVQPDEAGIKDPEHEKTTYLYCFDDSCLQGFIEKSGLLKQQQIGFAFVWKDTYEKAKEIICSNTEPSFVRMLDVSAGIYGCTTAPSLPELPDGYKARNLRPEDSDTVLTGVWYKDVDYVKSVRRVLQHGALSVGVENGSGQLVAWTLQHVTGLLGMTFVIPEHRNKKLGKYVTAALAQKMIAQDGFCWAGIEDENSVSVSLHENLGFKKMELSFVSGMYCESTYASSVNLSDFPDPSNKNWKK